MGLHPPPAAAPGSGSGGEGWGGAADAPAVPRAGMAAGLSPGPRPVRWRLPPSGVKEQAYHGADFAGKPSPEGTKVLVMELLELGGLADIAEKGSVKVGLGKDDQEEEQDKEESNGHEEQTEDT